MAVFYIYVKRYWLPQCAGGTSRYQVLKRVLHVGVAGAAGELWSTGQGAGGPSWRPQKASGRPWAITPESHALRPCNTMVMASALLLQGIGCDKLDYKKRCSSVTQGSDDRRRVTTTAAIGWRGFIASGRQARCEAIPFDPRIRVLFRHREAHQLFRKQFAVLIAANKQQQSP
jgi:hypothetical protein